MTESAGSGPPAVEPFRAEPLEGVLVHLRPVRSGDVEALALVLGDPSVARWWLTADPPAEARTLTEPDEERVVWAIELDGTMVGIVQAWEESDPEYRHAGIDIGLMGTAQGRGLGPDAIRAVARWLFGHRRHHRLTIDPRRDNDRAISAYAKVGFRPVGVMRAYELGADREWHDGLLMDLLSGELIDGR